MKFSRSPVLPVAGALLLACLVACAGREAGPVGSRGNARLDGRLVAGGRALSGAVVNLYVTDSRGPRGLGSVTSGRRGEFALSYAAPASGVLYVWVNAPVTRAYPGPGTPGATGLVSVVGWRGDGGGVRPRTLRSVVVNELTTVATTFAMAQFFHSDSIRGPSPGLENAAATVFNLVDPARGRPGAVLSDENNGSRNATLATVNTLANLAVTCSGSGNRARCAEFLRLASPPGGRRAANTVQALHNLVTHPTLRPARLFSLARTEHLYRPMLSAPPGAWMLALLYTADDLFSSGRIAIDAKGNVWSSVNWAPGTTEPATTVTVLDPVGRPTLRSPISGGGMLGGGWGAAIARDGSAWFGSFGGNAMSKYSGSGTPLSPSGGITAGALDHPQGVAVDRRGNVWIANNYGPESAPGQGNVVVYPGGDPSRAITITGGGINHPFAIQIDGRGNAWVTNAGLGGAKLVDTRLAILIGKFGGSVTVIGADFKPTAFSPIQSRSFRWPLGLSLDSEGNAWVVNFFGNNVMQIRPSGAVAGTYRLSGPAIPFSEAVDGSDRVWVAGFGLPGVQLLCGVDTAACPPGARTGTLLSPAGGFRSAAMQHLTSIQIDPSGNVWLSNNWSELVPKAGGTGIVELIGMATPVCTPLIGLPVDPSASSAGCNHG